MSGAESSAPLASDAGLAEHYLDLMKRVLTDYIRLQRGAVDRQRLLPKQGSLAPKQVVDRMLSAWMGQRDIGLYHENLRVDKQARLRSRSVGRDWPEYAETMIGLRRLDNIQRCVTDALARGVPGDLMETGSWRGGATIFMRALLLALGDEQRRVWVADSFEGLPPPDPEKYPADAGDDHHGYVDLRIDIEDVKDNFRRFNLLDERVVFLKGWFEETLPIADVERLAVLRLDGDMYGSTMVALESLYPKLSPGGYLIIDDYGAVDACRQAVEDYRSREGIREPIEQVDWTGAFWRKNDH